MWPAMFKYSGASYVRKAETNQSPSHHGQSLGARCCMVSSWGLLLCFNFLTLRYPPGGQEDGGGHRMKTRQE